MSQNYERRQRTIRRRLGDVPILNGFAISVLAATILMGGFAWFVG